MRSLFAYCYFLIEEAMLARLSRGGLRWVRVLGATLTASTFGFIEQYGRLLRNARRLNHLCCIYAMRSKRRHSDIMRWRQSRLLTSRCDLLFLFNILRKQSIN